MNKIVQYVPSFFEGFESKERHFETIQDLLDIDFVKIYSINTNGEPDYYFYRYALFDNYLIAEINDGRQYHIIGEIDDISNLNLLPKRFCDENN